MKFNFAYVRVAAVAAALTAQAAIAATVDQPSTIIYGGGATLPAIAYVGGLWLNSLPAARLSNTLPPAPGAKSNNFAADKASLFGAYALSTAAGTQKAGTVGIQYCQTGSGTGRKALDNVVDARGQCGDYSGSAVGFSGVAVDPNFAASDAPLAQSEITAFNTTNATTGINYQTTHTQQVQLPAVAGAVAVVYNNADLGKVQLNLTRSDICGIFSGQITNWTQLAGHTPKFKGTLTSKPIKLVYRSDGSGTTFSFTNHLSKVCSSLSNPGDTAVTGFKTTDTFQGGSNLTNSPAAYLTSAQLTSASASGQSGNGAVVGYVANSDGAIGYAEVADAVSRAKLSGGSNLKLATVSYAANLPKSVGVLAPGASFTCPAGTPGTSSFSNSGTKPLKYTCAAVVHNALDPAKNLLAKGTTAYGVTAKGDEVITPDDSNGRPVVATRTDTLAAGAVSGCLMLVEPNSYAEPAAGATKTAALDYVNYPIVAVSYLLGYGTGNGTKTAALNGFFKAPYNATVLSKVKTIGKTTGYAPLAVTLDASAAAATMSNVVDACVRN